MLTMLATLLSLSTFIKHQDSFLPKDNSIVFVEYQKNSTSNALFTSIDLESKDLLFNESENTEIEIELNLSHDYSFTDNFLRLNYDYKKLLTSNKFLNSIQKLPLYDLFCNWKLNFFNT